MKVLPVRKGQTSPPEHLLATLNTLYQIVYLYCWNSLWVYTRRKEPNSGNWTEVWITAYLGPSYTIQNKLLHPLASLYTNLQDSWKDWMQGAVAVGKHYQTSFIYFGSLRAWPIGRTKANVLGITSYGRWSFQMPRSSLPGGFLLPDIVWDGGWKCIKCTGLGGRSLRIQCSCGSAADILGCSWSPLWGFILLIFKMKKYCDFLIWILKSCLLPGYKSSVTPHCPQKTV